MNETEYLILDEWFKWLVSEKNIKPDLIVYLRTKPETVYERVLQRSRKEETSISLVSNIFYRMLFKCFYFKLL